MNGSSPQAGASNGNSAFAQLPTWDGPVMLAERELVELRRGAQP